MPRDNINMMDTSTDSDDENTDKDPDYSQPSQLAGNDEVSQGVSSQEVSQESMDLCGRLYTILRFIRVI